MLQLAPGLLLLDRLLLLLGTRLLKRSLLDGLLVARLHRRQRLLRHGCLERRGRLLRHNGVKRRGHLRHLRHMRHLRLELLTLSRRRKNRR